MFSGAFQNTKRKSLLLPKIPHIMQFVTLYHNIFIPHKWTFKVLLNMLWAKTGFCYSPIHEPSSKLLEIVFAAMHSKVFRSSTLSNFAMAPSQFWQYFLASAKFLTAGYVTKIFTVSVKLLPKQKTEIKLTMLKPESLHRVKITTAGKNLMQYVALNVQNTVVASYVKSFWQTCQKCFTKTCP